MANDISNLQGVEKRIADMIGAIGEAIMDKVLIVIDRTNIAPAPTSAVWSYDVPFRIVGEVSGNTIPINGTIGAAASDTSTAGTASVPSATVDVVNGVGIAKLEGDAQAWLNAETATLTLTYTNLRGGTDTDTFVVTFTS